MTQGAGGPPRADPTRRPGRPPGSPDTRGRILRAARTAFGERGYDGATIRDIAARAGVDSKLIHHYFGTKQRLFVAAVELPVDFAAVIPRLVAGPPDRLGERLARFVLGLWDRPELQPLLLGIVRSASTDPTAAAMLRQLLTEGPMLTVATSLGRPDATARASLAGSQLIGVLFARYVVGVEPLASMDLEALTMAIAPSMQRYLAGDLLGGAADAPADGSGAP